MECFMSFQQLAPVEVERSKKNGMWIHPELKKYLDENLSGVDRFSDEDWVTMQDELGVTLVVVEIFDDENVDDELIRRLTEEDDLTAIIDWNPTAPYGDEDYFLVQVFENEDGVSAMWAKKK